MVILSTKMGNGKEVTLVVVDNGIKVGSTMGKRRLNALQIPAMTYQPICSNHMNLGSRAIDILSLSLELVGS